ncbi:hypothetical protein VTH82DRAFT_1831 [Thermothelomyces myriococcoides]
MVVAYRKYSVMNPVVRCHALYTSCMYL